MLTKTSKYLTWVIFFLVGVGYVSVMSNIEIHYFWKSLIIFLPIQLVTVIYVTAKLLGMRDWGLVTTDKQARGAEETR
jgi:hypothetical protein